MTRSTSTWNPRGAGDREPSLRDLRAIEAEWPVIAAELAVVQAEVWLAAEPADALARVAHRRAVRRLAVARPVPVRRGRPRRVA